MICPMTPADLDGAADLWLAANLDAHPFISPEYWRENLPFVREALARAEVYLYTERGALLGFIGLEGDYIAGLFVDASARGRGVGRALLDFVKGTHDRLSLSVYAQNDGARRFYLREGFRVASTGVDDATGAAELHLRWP